MKIENIKKLNSGKYKLTFENKDKMITYDDVILNNGLLFKHEIDTKMLDKLAKDNYYYDIYNKLIKYISIRIRSNKEINQYLEKFNLDTKTKNEIIDNLKKIGLINDLFFTKAYINDKLYLSNSGPYKIANELKEHDIDDLTIDEALSKIDNEFLIDKLSKIIFKKIKTNHKYSTYMLKQKLLSELINQGYDKDMIVEIYDSSIVNSSNILEETYEKIHNQLSKKYSGYELSNKIKQKLFQKGFDINEIIQLLSNKLGN